MHGPVALTPPTWEERDRIADELAKDFPGADVFATETGFIALSCSPPLECHSEIVMRMLLQREIDEAQISGYRRTGLED